MSGRGLRVTGGELCGRRLHVSARGVRPTTDRVRESLFARLGALDDADVLDLYAGSGILGVEALSRGARRAVFIERGEQALAVLRDNLAALGLEAVTQVVRGDVARSVRRLGRAGERFDLVLVDPPYESGEAARALAALAEADVLAPEAVVVVEHGRRHPVPSIAGWVALEEWTYGETGITRLGRGPWRQDGAAGDGGEGGGQT